MLTSPRKGSLSEVCSVFGIRVHGPYSRDIYPTLVEPHGHWRPMLYVGPTDIEVAKTVCLRLTVGHSGSDAPNKHLPTNGGMGAHCTEPVRIGRSKQRSRKGLRSCDRFLDPFFSFSEPDRSSCSPGLVDRRVRSDRDPQISRMR